MKLKTCRDCAEMKVSHIGEMAFAGCKITEKVVPQYADPGGIIFRRVPMNCPRDSNEVLKSEEGIDFREIQKR